MDKKDLLYMFLPTVLVLAVLAITVAVGLMLRGGEESCRSIRVVELKGDVSIDREGVGSLEASVNMDLISGDRISTSEDAYVVLQLDEDKYVMLGEQGAIQVHASGNAVDGRTQIHLEIGTIVNDIRNPLSQNSTYEIVTPGGAMSVRGTVFEARWHPDDSMGELVIYEGSVELTLQGKEPMLYSHGEYAQFEAGDTPQFLIKRGTIKDTRMDLRMIPFLYQIIESGRELDFGEANFEQLINRASDKGLLTIADNRFQTTQESGDSSTPDMEDPATSPSPTEKFLPLGLEDHVMDWQDENLEALMRKTTGIMDGDIMLSDVWELRSLEMEAKSASTIKNISALSELTNLTELELPCGLQDISPLSSLTNLTSLYLENNQISDISPLSSLINLKSLALYNNQISDISALSGLTNLTTLYLFINQISDISVLGGLTNLTSLTLDENQISDISALSSLTNLRSLDLSSNQISDISALSSLTYLKSLDLSNNQITDISALSNLTSLTYLNLSQNPIIDYSVVEFVEKNGGNVIY